ncbi:glycosyltransferase family 32 protein [Neobacillus sp. C211]|uniref:glycosyltransferase family 32 protein n=1 Tax=unclassified Neobacillus TaxID=2675272 RepID=UPI003977E96B
MSIPKIIHYCWFGGKEKPKLIDNYMKSWGILQDYQIIEWNENNFDINSNPYVKKAYELKQYAFVSDYVRLKALNDMGGIYLDTDIEIKKDISEFLNHKLFIGFMYNCLLGTAIFGAEKSHPTIKGLLDRYSNLELKITPNNNLYTRYFLDQFLGFKLNNQFQLLDYGIAVYPKEYFERPTYNKKMGYSIHHYSASWKEENKFKKVIKQSVKFLIGDVSYSILTHSASISKTPFYEIYLEHKENR